MERMLDSLCRWVLIRIRCDMMILLQELWDLLISAQASVGGIPAKFLEMKKEQLRIEREEQDRIQNSLQRHEDIERERERELLEQRSVFS